MKSMATRRCIFIGLGIVFALGGLSTPAIAHHVTGGNLPDNSIAGLLSGLAHPVIGIDHLAFVVAIGLLASLRPKQGVFLPIAFILATIGGTLIHLGNIDLPFSEGIIALSVLGVGLLLTFRENPPLLWIFGIGAIAGLFHGYAYGEAIIGARMTALMAYLIGFATIQAIIAYFAFRLGTMSLNPLLQQTSLPLRFAGFTIGGMGIAFLSSAIGG